MPLVNMSQLPQVKLPPYSSPSTVSVSDTNVVETLVSASPAFNDNILRALLEYFDETKTNKYMCVAEAIREFIRKHTSSNIGTFSASNGPAEIAYPELFAAHVQYLFAVHFSTSEERAEPYPTVACFAQNKLGGSTVPIAMYRDIGSGLHIRVIWKFSITDYVQDGQLVAHCNNCDQFIGDDKLLILLGVMVRMEPGTRAWFTFAGFVKAVQHNSDGTVSPRLCCIPIDQGDWDRHSISKVICTIHMFMSRPVEDFMVAPDALPDVAGCKTTVTMFTDPAGTFVYKVYDNRTRGSHGSKNPAMSIKYIPNCVMVLETESPLTIIKYPYIPGEHLPQYSKSVLGILRQLHKMHTTDSVLHMDIKAGNCLFSADGEQSCLIDFDYAGQAGRVVYPDTFNIAITDGARHPEVAPGAPGRYAHDRYALGAVLALCRAADIRDQPRWDDICSRVASEEDLGVLINVLMKARIFQLVPIRTVSSITTGSLPAQK